MTAIIVDDEPLARALLRGMLERANIQIIGEAGEAASGLTLAEELAPEVVFLDVRMPGLSGIESTGHFAQLEPAPLLILVTGHSEYAVEAFGKSALDYLLKPVSEERLLIALGKARKQLALVRRSRRIEAMQRTARQSPILRIPIRNKGAIRLLPVEKVLYAMASDKSVLIKTKDGEFKTSYTLAHLEAILPTNFMRVHASCIVNLGGIEEILLFGNHCYGIKLFGGEELPLGRLQYAKLQERLGFSSSP